MKMATLKSRCELECTATDSGKADVKGCVMVGRRPKAVGRGKLVNKGGKPGSLKGGDIITWKDGTSE